MTQDFFLANICARCGVADGGDGDRRSAIGVRAIGALGGGERQSVRRTSGTRANVATGESIALDTASARAAAAVATAAAASAHLVAVAAAVVVVVAR